MSRDAHTGPAATYLLILSEREALAWVMEKERMAFPARQSAEVTSPVRVLDESVTIAGRDFTRGCDLKVERVTPYRTGVEVTPLVPELEIFPDTRPGAWTVRIRRPLLRLGGADTELLTRRLEAVVGDPAELVPEYVERVREAVQGRRVVAESSQAAG